MKRSVTFFLSVIGLFGVLASASAQPQQSENFRITKSVLDAGGGASTSTDFRLVSAFGQPSPVGLQVSANFVLSGGFLSPTFLTSPLSPIQALVIQQLNPDVKLCWPRITGAVTYKVYRSSDPLFAPGPLNYVGTTSDTAYTDANIASLPAMRNYYIVTALNGRGGLLTLPPQQPDAPQTATKATLIQPARPNPDHVSERR